jgi:carboxylesterase type B
MHTSAVQITIANGRIEGLQFERHQAFLGIPFAAPPIGARRF